MAGESEVEGRPEPESGRGGEAARHPPWVLEVPFWCQNQTVPSMSVPQAQPQMTKHTSLGTLLP